MDRSDRRRRPVIAVVERLAQQAPRLIEQTMIDAPRVDPDADQGLAGPADLAQAAQDLPVEAEDVPVEPVRGSNRVVREAADLGQLEDVAARPGRPSPDRSTRRDRRPRRARGSPEEGRRHTRIDGDVQTGRLAQVAAGQGEDGGRDMLGQDLVLEQRALRVELPELVFGDPVGPRPVGPPTLGEDPRAADDAVRD